MTKNFKDFLFHLKSKFDLIIDNGTSIFFDIIDIILAYHFSSVDSSTSKKILDQKKKMFNRGIWRDFAEKSYSFNHIFLTK